MPPSKLYCPVHYTIFMKDGKAHAPKISVVLIAYTAYTAEYTIVKIYMFVLLRVDNTKSTIMLNTAIFGGEKCKGGSYTEKPRLT